jgi:hypothetical protein
VLYLLSALKEFADVEWYLLTSVPAIYNAALVSARQNFTGGIPG